MSAGPSPALAPPLAALGVFQAYGIETEYMIVDAQTLDIAAAAPAMLRELRGVPPS